MNPLPALLVLATLIVFASGMAASNNHTASLPELSIGSTLSGSPLSDRIEQRLQLAYQQLGYHIRFFPLPSERRLRLVQLQELEGDLFRVCSLQQDYADIVVIPVPLGELQLNAYSLAVGKLDNWQQNPRLIVVHIRGFKMAEHTHFAGKRLEVANHHQAFGLLHQERADIVLEDNASADAFFQSNPEFASLPWHAAALEYFPVCHILGAHMKHLAEPLQQLLSQPDL